MRYISLIFCILLLITSCGKKCKEDESKKSYLDPELNAYFGVFKKGNYWVYENQDQIQRDSIYVTESDRKFILDVTACDDAETLTFTLKEKNKDVVIVGDSVCCNGQYNELNFRVCPSGAFFTGFSLMHFNLDTIETSEGIVNTVDYIKLNNITYSNQIIQIYEATDTLYMQKNVGIIGWKKNNDTYNLINKYLQP